MVYIVTVNNPVYADDFMPSFGVYRTLEEAQKCKALIDAEGDYFTTVTIYEAKRIA